MTGRIPITMSHGTNRGRYFTPRPHWRDIPPVDAAYADLVGIEGDDEPDGGPPSAARYITRDTHPYRLPSMDFEHQIHDLDAFRRYLEGALESPDTEA